MTGGDVKYLYSSEDTIEFYGHYEDKIAFLQGMWDDCFYDVGAEMVFDVDMETYSWEERIGMDEDGVYFMGYQDNYFHICRTSYEGEITVFAEIPLLDIVTDEAMDLFVDEEENHYAFSDYGVPDADFAGNADAEAPSGVQGDNDLGILHMGHYNSPEGYHLYAVPEHSGCNYILLSAEEIDALEIETPLIHKETGGAVQWNIVRAEYVGDKLFFSVEISDHDIEQNIGWRDFYVRRITYDYYKNLSTGEIKLIQSY